MDRRVFLTLAGAASTAPAHEWLLAHPVADAASATGLDLPPDTVEQLDTITDALRRMDDSLGGGQPAALVREHLSTVVSLIRTRRYPDSLGRRLHASSGELLRLAGWLAFDSGDHARAQRFWISALHQAHTAGDKALAANTLGFMSCQAKDLSQPRAAVTLAETAKAGYPGGSSRVAAILELRAAEAYANEGDAERCRRAVDAAFNQLSMPAPEHGHPAWSYWLTEAHAHGQAGYCYLRLADYPRARQHFNHAQRLQDTAITREGTLRQTLLATTYASQPQPDIDRAVALGSRAIRTLSDQVQSSRCVKHVRTLAERLAPFRSSPAVREFHDQARQLFANA
jgi:hypothetical protein